MALAAKAVELLSDELRLFWRTTQHLFQPLSISFYFVLRGSRFAPSPRAAVDTSDPVGDRPSSDQLPVAIARGPVGPQVECPPPVVEAIIGLS